MIADKCQLVYLSVSLIFISFKRFKKFLFAGKSLCAQDTGTKLEDG